MGILPPQNEGKGNQNNTNNSGNNNIANKDSEATQPAEESHDIEPEPQSVPEKLIVEKD